MKRFLSMILCLMIVFTMIASYSICFAGIEDIHIVYTEENGFISDGTKADGSTKDVLHDKNGIGQKANGPTMKVGYYERNEADMLVEQGFNWNTLFSRYKGVIVGISGVAALTFLVFFIINFMKLGQSSGNPQMRSQALMGIVWCGIACAGLGGVAIFFGFFYNVLKK